MHPVLQEQITKHLTDKGIVLTPEFNEFLTAVDEAYVNCDNDRQAFMVSSKMLAEAQTIANTGSWTLETETKAITWSDELYRIFGVDKKDFTPSYDSFLQFVHPDDKQQVNDNWLKTIGGQMIERSEFRIVLKDGLVKWVQSRSYAADGQNNKLPTKLVGTLQDVTDRKNLENAMIESNERLRLLFDNSPEGYLLTTAGGVILDVNKTSEQRSGLSRTETIGHNLFDLNLLSPADQQSAHQMIEQVVGENKASLPQEFTIHRRGGQEMVVEATIYPVTIQQEKLILAITRDITKEKEAAINLKKRAAELEKLNQLMVGRELKMVELKKEKDELKKKIGMSE